MRKLFLFCMLAAAVAASCDQLGNLGDLNGGNGDAETVEVMFTYSMPDATGKPMAATKLSDDEIFMQFYEEIVDGNLVAPEYELSLINEATGEIHDLKAPWKDNRKWSLAPGTYSLSGKATASGKHIQKECSIVFDETITVDENTVSIRLSADYDAALIIFNDSDIAKISNFDGTDETTDLYRFGDYFYAFVNDKLYDEGTDSYLVLTLANGETMGLSTVDVEFTKGCYYVYSDIMVNGEFDFKFDIPGMDNGKEDEEPDYPVVEMVVNPDWTVEYTGAQVFNDVEYEHTATVTSTDDNKYFIVSYNVETVDYYDIEVIASYELDYLKSLVDSYVQAGYDLTIDDFLFVGSGVEVLDSYPGDYYALAIGVDDNGNLSGLYAMSEVFTIKEAEPTAEYASWLGSWTWTGSNGVAWNVNFSKGLSNEYYMMSGWEGFGEGDGLEIPVYWSQDSQVWAIYPYDFGVFSFGEEDGYIYVAAVDESYNVNFDFNAAICMGGLTEDGSRVCLGYSGESEDGTSFTANTMMYLVEMESGLYMLSDLDWPSFPITITPAQGTRSAAAVKPVMKGIQKYIKKPRTLKLSYPTRKIASR